MAVAFHLDQFRFNTNQFLAPIDNELPLIDFDDLFGVLAPGPGATGAGSSGAGTPPQQSDSSGLVASPAQLPHDFGEVPLPHEPPSLAQQRQPKKDVRSVRDASKRARDTNNKKQQPPNQVKELEALAAQKSEQLHQLTRENNELRFRQQMLEKVVQMQDHQLKVMRGAAEDLPQPWCSAAQAQAQAGAAAAAACAATSNSTSCGGGGGGGGAQPAWHGGSGGSAAVAVRQMSAGCLLACGDVVLPPVDRERFRTLGKAKLMEGWKHFLSEVAAPMLAMEADPGDEAAAGRLRQLAAEATYLLKHASLLAPDTVMTVSQTHLETEALSPPDPSHWNTVLRMLELSPRQVSELVAVWSLFRGIMAGVLAERRAINAKLAEGLHGTFADAVAAMERLTIAPECEVMQTLQRNLRREKAAHLLLRGYLFGQTLSALQFVRAAVYAYPWLPDATAIVATVAEGQEEGEAARGGEAEAEGSDA